ncbi:hypothetical protein D9615_006722 [Tricholomella constricta]|uniref:DUF6699 domain-containing protein n=1 Tax=Tricholomella constricta TaxID=117010 RepID=A0A8H5H6H6_9AGAR|nr:hypothetical protein D9615_006722 [Tricholomella constricta]
MFKWSKRRPSGEPSTPKLGSISLPDETPVKTASKTLWRAEVVTTANSGVKPDQRSKDRHPVASGAPPTRQSSRRRASPTISPLEEVKQSKPVAPNDDGEAGYLSSREGHKTLERTSSKATKAPLKGILKPPKPFTEQDHNKPEIFIPPYPKGWPANLDELGRRGGSRYYTLIDFNNTPAMKEKVTSHPLAGEDDTENTSQTAAQSRYKPLAPPIIPQGTSPPPSKSLLGSLMIGANIASGRPIVPPGYPTHAPAPVMSMNGPYYATHPSQHPSQYPGHWPVIPPQHPAHAPARHHGHPSRYGDGGMSDNEGLSRAPSSRHAGGYGGGLSNAEGLSRSYSGSEFFAEDSFASRAMHPLAQHQQPPLGYEHFARNRAATHPVYPDTNGAPPMNQHYGATDYSRSRHHSFSGYAPPGPPPPHPDAAAAAPTYVRPHITRTTEPQKEPHVALSWPLLEHRKVSRQRPPRPILFFDLAFDPTELAIYALDTIMPPRGPVVRPIGTPRRPMRPEELKTPVSPHCVVTDMKIVCEERELWRWPVYVSRAEGLRCIDVYQAIYETYHVPLTDGEKTLIGKHVVAQSQPAFMQRCNDSPNQYEEHRRGMCRVDLLRTKRLLKGLTRRDGVWKLEVEHPQERSL